MKLPSLSDGILWECVERHVITRAYSALYRQQKERDWRFIQLLQSYQFITPKHLDIRVPVPATLLDSCLEGTIFEDLHVRF